MFQPTWSLTLPEPATHACICLLPTPSILYQGVSNQLSVYLNNESQHLPIRKEILDVACINETQVLMLTKYQLACFDLLRNEEVFNKEFEGAESMYVFDAKIYVVCRTILSCYDWNGEELFVTHLPHNITCVCPYNSEIVIAMEEDQLHRYQGSNIVFEYGKVGGIVNSMVCIGRGILVGTKEGSLAYYESKKYKWRSKSTHEVSNIIKFNDGVNSDDKGDWIVVVRKDGLMELRDWENGATITKIKLGENTISVMVDDYRNEGFKQLIVVLSSGLVKAFSIEKVSSNNESKPTTVEETFHKINELESLQKIKQDLIYQISELKEAMANKNDDADDNAEILSSEFKMSACLIYREGLILILKAENGFISGLTFEESIMPVMVDRKESLEYKFENKSINHGEVVCEVLVHSSFSATKFVVKKITITLAKFWKWGLDPKIHHEISGRLSFKLLERNSRFLLWMKECFLMNLSTADENKLEASSEMKFRFYNWYENKELELCFYQKEGLVEINCDCLKTMGDVFQDLINYVGVKNVNSELNFPEEKENIKSLIAEVEKYTQVKVSMSTDLADTINNVKFLLVKSESARAVSSMNSFRKTYAEIMEQNRNLVTEIEKKNQNTKALTETLKNVNAFINQIANIRYGESKNQIIAKCREAIKTKRFPQIYSIMDKGVEGV